MKYVFYHHGVQGPFSLQELYTGHVPYAATVTRLRILFWLAANSLEVNLAGNVIDGDFSGVRAISDSSELGKMVAQCTVSDPLLLIMNSVPDQDTWKYIQQMKCAGLYKVLWAAGPFGFEWMSRVAAGEIDRIICISETQRNLYRLYPGFEKLEVIYLGIDLDFMPPSEHIEQNPLWVLSTSVPRRTKGFDNLLNAWNLVRQQVPNAHLRVCGSALLHDLRATLGVTRILDADLEAEFPEYFAQYPHSTQKAGIELMGNRPLPEVYSDLQYARLAVVNSNWDGSLEMFCRSAVEAQMAGVPVVGAARGSLPEVVAHGKTGLLIDREDIVEFANAIVTLLRDDDLHKRMSKDGPAWAHSMADYKTIAPMWEKFAHRLMANKLASVSLNSLEDVGRKLGYGRVKLWIHHLVHKYKTYIGSQKESCDKHEH